MNRFDVPLSVSLQSKLPSVFLSLDRSVASARLCNGMPLHQCETMQTQL